ncbi:MAG: DUF134 domain-containing protein [Candidatus Omnitrophica bacterium]|nr:DUF134 domain-containing protein [Candidatus Omnitrophota bacterium]
MRPQKTRWVRCAPGERCFRPQCQNPEDLQGVVLGLDEFEAVRLLDLERCTQEEAAAQMGVHRSTVSRILESARRKIADALVNMKAIKIEGGCCAFGERMEDARKK